VIVPAAVSRALLPRPGWSRQRRRNLLLGLAFTSPWIVGFLVFVVFPILASLYFSFTDYDVIRAPRLVGLRNFTRLIQTDRLFWTALYNTAYFVLIGVPGSVLVGFILAVLLNRKMPFRPLARTVFFLPSIVPQVASALLWLWIFAPQYGLLNAYFQMVGKTSIPWLSDPALAKLSLILIHVWSSGGVMVIFLAALQDVPRHLYEAARIDGASWLHELWHVTVPMVTPAILFNLITGLIFGFQYFTFAWLLTGGGPVNSTEFYSMYLYRNAFVFFKMGYASAMAWILFLVVVVCTVLLFKSSARWAYYGGTE
jgi:multiple sugar transport system permease protein